MIKLLCVFLVICGAIPAFSRPTGKYTTKFDNVDIDKILKNDRLLNNYVRCLLGKGSCTRDGTELKKLLPEALRSGCVKCTEKQKRNTHKVLLHLIDSKPELYLDLERVYDPNGEYRRKFCRSAREEGFQVEQKCN